MDRNYALEVVTDTMHNQVPNLITAQRAHDENERQADVIRALNEQVADLQAQRERLRKALSDLIGASDRVREAIAIGNARKSGGMTTAQMGAELTHYTPAARAALAGGGS